MIVKRHDERARRIIGKGGQLLSIYIPHEQNGDDEVKFGRDHLYDLLVAEFDGLEDETNQTHVTG